MTVGAINGMVHGMTAREVLDAADSRGLSGPVQRLLRYFSQQKTAEYRKLLQDSLEECAAILLWSSKIRSLIIETVDPENDDEFQNGLHGTEEDPFDNANDFARVVSELEFLSRGWSAESLEPGDENWKPAALRVIDRYRGKILQEMEALGNRLRNS